MNKVNKIISYAKCDSGELPFFAYPIDKDL
jgi:hypothetical protein